MLIKFQQFVNEILADNSRLAKIAVLEKYKDDEDIKYLLNFVYNPYIITGISDKKLNKQLSQITDNVFETDKELFEYIKIHNTGRDEDIRIVQNYELDMLRPLGWQLEVLYEKIITKNLPLGIDAKTINKVIPDLIPEFNVQLSNKYFEKPEIVEGKKFAITTKIDGSRIIAMKENGQVSFWTRQGQPYEGLVDLEKEMLEYMPDNICLDGEIVAIDTDKENTYKNTMKLSRTKDLEKHGLKMIVFDCLLLSQFKNQKCLTPYYARRYMLDEIFHNARLKKLTEVETIDKFPVYFDLLPVLYEGTDTSKILEILNEQTEKGEEGIMINIVDAPYDFKRSNNLLKVKKFQDMELPIIGFEEGTGKHLGKLGAFICKYKDNEVRVGSGLTDEDRETFWNIKDTLLGKLITIKYFEETHDSKTNLPSLRFPTFMRIRED